MAGAKRRGAKAAHQRQPRKKVDRCDVCTEDAGGGCGTCAFNGNL